MTAAPGTWTLVIATPMGKQQASVTLTDESGTLGGTATSGDETVTLEDVLLEGNHLSWHQEVTKPFKTTVTFNLDIDGDTITGTAKPGMFPASAVTGTRA